MLWGPTKHSVLAGMLWSHKKVQSCDGGTEGPPGAKLLHHGVLEGTMGCWGMMGPRMVQWGLGSIMTPRLAGVTGIL